MTEPIEARLAEVETQLRDQTQLRSELQQVELFVRKLQARAKDEAGEKGAGFSTYTSLCTSACFSSAACLCPGGSLTAATQDPEVAGVFATLHRRGVETLGEEGFMEAIIAKAKGQRGKLASPFET
jgi:hypothetical protein